MLSKKQRLLKKEVEYLLRRGRHIASPYFNLKAISNHFANNRYSVIISKKILKKAVDRNKARRQTYEIIRSLTPQLDFGMDIAILPKPKYLELEIPAKTQLLIENITAISPTSKAN